MLGRHVHLDRLWETKSNVKREEAQIRGHKDLVGDIGTWQYWHITACARCRCGLVSYTLLRCLTSIVRCRSCKQNRYSGHEPGVLNIK